MKRTIIMIAILLFGVIGYAQNKTADIRKGNTYADLSFTAADTINESETYYIEVTNFQDYPAMQDVIFSGSAVSGSGNVVVTLYGKKFAGSSYSSLGAVTWDSSADTTYTISVTTANRYRYLKLEFASDATDKQVLLTDAQFKNWFTGGDLSSATLTLTGALSVGTTSVFTGAATFNGGITLGAGDDLIGSATSDITFNTNKFTVAGATGNTVVGGTLDVTGALGLTASATLGAGADLIGSATSDITINTDKFTVAGATGNTAIGGTLDVTGAVGLTASATLGAGADLLLSTTSDITVSGNTFNVAGATGAVQASLYNFADATAVAGTADAITIDFTVDLTVTTGTIITFVAEAANTGAATLNVDGAGAIAIVEASDGSALEAGDIANGMVVQVVYDGTSWVQISQSGN